MDNEYNGYSNLDNFPKDMLYEIFTHLEFEDLLKSYAPNKHWTESLRTEIIRRISTGALREDKYSLIDFRKLGKTYPFIVKSIVAEINRRLNHNYFVELFEKLSEKFPNNKWNYIYVSSNPNINMDYIISHPQIPWSYVNVSRNPSITMQDVLDHPDKPWSYIGLSSNPNITFQDVLNNLQKPWNYTEMSMNPNITFQDVLSYPDKPWNYNWVSHNPNITFHDVLNHPDKSWAYFGLSRNPNTTLQDVLSHPEIQWYFPNLPANSNITLQDIFSHPEIPWNTAALSNNPNITFQDILNYPEISWDYSDLSKNPNITLQDLLIYPVKSWYYQDLSSNPNITLQDVLNHPEIHWNYTLLSDNKFSKDPAYIKLAHNIITEISINFLNSGKVLININGTVSELTLEQIYGLIVGLHSANKLEQNTITFWDIPINIKNVKNFFGIPIKDTKYLIYVDGKPHHFASLDFLSGLKIAIKDLKNTSKSYFDKLDNYKEILIDD